LDQVGNPAVDGTLVNFSQTVMTGGGERLSSTSAQSINGKVQVVLQSGVRSGAAEIAGVLAVNGGSNVVTTARVVIAAGLPDAKHFSLSALPLNLPGYVFYGEKSLITAYLADRYSNPVPVATPVFFESEAGAMALEDLTPSSLGDNKTNGAGQAFATQITQAPKPDTLPNKGLSTILAWTIGAESFVDLNGNGTYNSGEPFGDLGEPYIDANDSGAYDAATSTSAEERYVDINGDSNYNGPNGQWDGQTAIWTDMDVLWSGLTAKPVISPASFNIAAGASQDFTITAADVNGNPLPAGATVTVSKTCFSGISLSGDTNVTIPDALAAKVGTTQFSVNFSSASTVVGDPMPCTLIVEVSEPTTGTTTAVVNGFID
ncbi:MAG: hypothetical protein L3J63_12190, partial [Geopsychrobacter sp.]|nr:hypothetical protein [Geopsychrobacter sp.]